MSGDRAGANRGNDRARLVALVDERRARVASYKVRGLSIRETQAALTAEGHVNPRTEKPWSLGILLKDVGALDERWKAEALADTTVHKAQQLQDIAEIKRQAWAGWYRSVGKKQQTFTERSDGGKGKGSKASVRTEELAGDPRYLAVVLDADERLAKVLGTDAPARIAGPGGGAISLAHEFPDGLTDDERAAKVAAILDAARARGAGCDPERAGEVGPAEGTPEPGAGDPG